MILMSYRGRPAFDGDLTAATTGVPVARNVRDGVGAERPLVIGEGRTTQS